MKKTLLNILGAGLLAFCGAATAQAQVTAADLNGTWTFTCEFDLVDDDYEGIVFGDSQVQIASNSNGLTITNFLFSEFQEHDVLWYASFDESTGEIKFNFATPDANFPISLTDIEGSFPYDSSFIPTYVEIWNVDNAETITVPDFSVVYCNFADSSTDMIATVKNGKLIKNEDSGNSGTITDFSGTYTVTGYKCNVPNDKWSNITYDITVEKSDSPYFDYQITSFAGYEGTDIVATAEGNTLTISNLAYQGLVPDYSKFLGQGNIRATEYDNDATITLSYVNGKWLLSDFTVWTGTYPDYVLEDFYQALSITWTGTDEDGDENSFVGTYKVTGSNTIFDNGTYVESNSNAEFTMVIIEGEEENEYYITEILGYNTAPEIDGYGTYYYVVAMAEGNQLTIDLSAYGNGTLQQGMNGVTLAQLDWNSTEYQAGGEIVFTKEGDTLTCDGFDVFAVNYDPDTYQPVYSLMQMWFYLTGELDDEGNGVESILDSVDPNAPVEFYNLQGQKVNNPGKGLYIVKQGKSAKKILIP